MDNPELKLSRFLLQKYSDIINEQERRTIGEIKALVSGNDLSVQSLVQDLKEKDYSFEKDYEKVLRKLFDFVKKEIIFVNADFGVNYWLTPKEVLEQKVADDEDLAAFVCSAIKALGDENAEVIVAELDNLKTHTFVMTQLKEKFVIIDPAQKHEFEEFLGKKEKIIEKYEFEGQKIKNFLYKYNSQKYEQFLE